jgi:hypothetical protein
VIGLVVLGGPAGVGSSLLFAHLRHSGTTPSEVVNTRAIVSFAPRFAGCRRPDRVRPTDVTGTGFPA